MAAGPRNRGRPLRIAQRLRRGRRSMIAAGLPAARTALLALLLIVAPDPLAAADGTQPSEAVFIAQIVVLLVCRRLLGEGMQRLGQPAVLGQLHARISLRPPLLGAP